MRNIVGVERAAGLLEFEPCSDVITSDCEDTTAPCYGDDVESMSSKFVNDFVPWEQEGPFLPLEAPSRSAPRLRSVYRPLLTTCAPGHMVAKGGVEG